MSHTGGQWLNLISLLKLIILFYNFTFVYMLTVHIDTSIFFIFPIFHPSYNHHLIFWVVVFFMYFY
nr:MAG TPA: hypothetical protein [Caudoviricetes sp.]